MPQPIKPATPFFSQIIFVWCLLALTLVVGACSKSGGGGNMLVKSPATGEKELPQKSGYAFAVNNTFTDTAGKISSAASYRVYVANYDLDAANFAMPMEKPLSADDQVRVVFSLVGEQGTNDKSPLKTGSYSAKANKFMKVEDVAVVSR